MVIVVGIPRSGTSWVTGEIHRLGYWVGPYGKGPDNPRGFFENNQVKDRFIKRFLIDKSGLSSLPESPLQSDVTREGFEAVLREQGWDGEPWVFKDCKALLFWPSFQRAFPEAVWIKVRRRYAEILESFSRTRFMRDADHRYVLEAYKARLLECPGVEVWPFEGDIRGQLGCLRA